MEIDYKFIILLIVLLAVILFFTKEIENLKCMFNEKLNQIVNSVETNSKSIKAKIQTDLTLCVGKIKSINGEYVEQVRKMNDYGSQPITNMSNHYTDSESKTKHMNIEYLSESKERNKLKKPKQSNSQDFYMSDASAENKQKTTGTTNTNDFKITYPSEKNSDNVNKNEKIDQHIEINNANMNKVEISKNISELSAEKIIKSTTQLHQFHDDSCDDSSDNSSDGISIKIDDFIPKSKTTTISSEQQNKSQGERSKEFSDESSEGSEESSKKSSIVKGSRMSKESQISSKFGLITLESKGKKTSKKQEDIEEESVATSEIKNITMQNLKPLDDYTTEYLKRVAKKMNIPLTQKIGSSRKQLKRDELYEKIKLMLSDKISEKSE